MTHEIGTELTITMDGGSSFEAVVITPEWARFELAQKLELFPMTRQFLDRIELTIDRVAYGAYDEVMCYWVGVAAQGGVGFIFRINQQWLMDTLRLGQMYALNQEDHYWSSTRVRIEVR